MDRLIFEFDNEPMTDEEIYRLRDGVRDCEIQLYEELKKLSFEAICELQYKTTDRLNHIISKIIAEKFLNLYIA